MGEAPSEEKNLRSSREANQRPAGGRAFLPTSGAVKSGCGSLLASWDTNGVWTVLLMRKVSFQLKAIMDFPLMSLVP